MPPERFEVIVVSDGSTDGTDEMLSTLTHAMPYRLTGLVQPNSGPAAARNRGIRAATGDIVVLTDDDLEPHPSFLEAHAIRHESDPRIVVLGPMSPDPLRARFEPPWIAWEHAKMQEQYDLFRPGGSNSDGQGGAVHFYSGNASVRREHLMAVGGFDENYRRQEDVELAVRLERECGVWFLFDFTAEATHRQSRSFESWMRGARAYGTLDAQRISAGTLSWAEVNFLAARRNPVTKALSNLCAAAPFLDPAVVNFMRAVVSVCWTIGARGPAISALSALYNSVYRKSLVCEVRRQASASKGAGNRTPEAGKPNA